MGGESNCERERERERERESYLEVVQHKHRQIDDKNGILLLQVQFILDQCVVADTQRLDLPQNETIARVHNSHKKYNMIYNVHSQETQILI